MSPITKKCWGKRREGVFYIIWILQTPTLLCFSSLLTPPHTAKKRARRGRALVFLFPQPSRILLFNKYPCPARPVFFQFTQKSKKGVGNF
ncbi:MAG: hypothetical protein ACTSRS_18985 [Candidatus Helarchaeota archaeon]